MASVLRSTEIHPDEFRFVTSSFLLYVFGECRQKYSRTWYIFDAHLPLKKFDLGFCHFDLGGRSFVFIFSKGDWRLHAHSRSGHVTLLAEFSYVPIGSSSEVIR